MPPTSSTWFEKRAATRESCGQRFPRKALLLDLYSRAVNTGRSVSTVTATVAPWANDVVDQIIEICRGYVATQTGRRHA